jgi:2-polyprenylphenol 6-hydroxylase
MHDVVVVGAGMVGAALALALAREGFAVAVVEPRPPAPWQVGGEVDLRVVALAPSSIDMFGRLDVWKSIVAARACPYRYMRVWDALAPGELKFDAADSGDAALGYIVENRLIQDVLWQALQHDDGRIAMHCPARVTGTESDAQRRTLILDDGSTLSARLVVAADGAESALRGMVGIQAHNRDYDQRAIVAHVVTERPHEDTAWQRFLPGATVAFLPLADGRSSVVWSVSREESVRLLALGNDEFRAELGAAMDFRLGSILQTTPRAAFDLRLLLAQRYLALRFAVVGDAAHVVHPLAGQGVNLGLRDVQELARVLVDARAAKRPFAAESELRKYERRRRSDNAISAYAFDSIKRVFGSQAMPLAALRGAALQLVDKVAPLKQMFARHAAGR